MSAVLHLPPRALASEAVSFETSLLRVLTCGSVDDGKSTLLGRLLFDSDAVKEDQLSALDQESRRWGTQGEARDFALLVDGLAAEREQGITIDVAYRYFSTQRRSFIVADTPGHEQYTRNMATGASTADLAIILVDARKGVLAQTRRHAFIVASIGIRHAVLAVNKMDLVGFSEASFQAIADEFRAAVSSLGFRSIVPIPISARDGDNVTTASERMPWFRGEPLLEHLETVSVEPPETEAGGFRLPVQLVVRPNPDFRGYAGTLTRGALRTGQDVVALPSGQRATIARIVTADGDRLSAEAGQAITLTLSTEIDISRGDVLAAPEDAPLASSQVRARLLWMERDPLEPGREFIVQLGTAVANARVSRIEHAIDIQTYAPRPAALLLMNEIGIVQLVFDKPLVFAPYAEDRTLGGLILVDKLTNRTAAMAVLESAAAATPGLLLDRLQSRVLAGALIGGLATALTSNLLLGAALGLAELLLHPVLERFVGASE